MCPTVRHRTRHSSVTVLRSQRHHHRRPIGRLLMVPKNQMPRSRPKSLLRPEKGGKLRRSQRLATRHERTEESRRRMVVGTRCLYPTQTGENSFQETTRRRGRLTSAVAGRSHRLIEFERSSSLAYIRYLVSQRGDRLSVSGHRLVHGHLDKHLQSKDRSRQF